MKSKKALVTELRQHGHPYGVQPWGNFYLKQQPEIRTSGLGLMSVLSDDVLLGILFHLSACDLARLGLASKALYCFAHTLDLWKALAIQDLPEDFRWCGSWRETYLCHITPGYKPGIHKPLVVEGFYSDFLHQPWFCAAVELQDSWVEVDNIDRRAGLTADEFRQQYELPNRPVVMTDKMTNWPAMGKWNRHYLAAALAGRPVIVGNMPWRFGSYLSYCDYGAEQDEMPLYMFDKAFASASPQLAADYVVPDVYSEDLFEVLGEDHRPDYRWLIIGPARSGSSFHIDPNATCAWNAVVCGRKKWILFPPNVTPPGVHPSPDGADVATPVSLIEWLLNFYEEARNSKTPPIETIQEPGEVIYVPRGWWHLALNLEPFTVAVTQNFVSSAGLPAVLKFLKPGKAELVSGCCLGDRSSLHDRFMAALQQQRPQVLQDLQHKQQRQQQQREAEHKLSLMFKQAPASGTCHHHQQHHQQQQQQQANGSSAAGVVDHQAALRTGDDGGTFSFGFNLSTAHDLDNNIINAGSDAHAAAAAAGDGGGGLGGIDGSTDGAGFAFCFSMQHTSSSEQAGAAEGLNHTADRQLQRQPKEVHCEGQPAGKKQKQQGLDKGQTVDKQQQQQQGQQNGKRIRTSSRQESAGTEVVAANGHVSKQCEEKKKKNKNSRQRC